MVCVAWPYDPPSRCFCLVLTSHRCFMSTLFSVFLGILRCLLYPWPSLPLLFITAICGFKFSLLFFLSVSFPICFFLSIPPHSLFLLKFQIVFVFLLPMSCLCLSLFCCSPFFAVCFWFLYSLLWFSVLYQCLLFQFHSPSFPLLLFVFDFYTAFFLRYSPCGLRFL